MRVAMITFGSQGDVRPLIALGQGLLRAGHQTVLLADSEFAALSAEVGMEFVPLAGGSVRDPAKHSEFDALFKRGLDPRVVMRVIFEHVGGGSGYGFMPSSRLCRVGAFRHGRAPPPSWSARHNQRVARKARSLSLGR